MLFDPSFETSQTLLKNHRNLKTETQKGLFVWKYHLPEITYQISSKCSEFSIVFLFGHGTDFIFPDIPGWWDAYAYIHVTPNSDVHMKAKLSTPSFLFTSCPPTFAVSAVEATAKRKKGPSNTAKWPAQDQNCKVACSGPAPSCKKGSQHHLVVEITYHPRDKGGRATKLHHSQSSHQAHVTPNSDVHMKAKLSTPSFLLTSCPPTFAVSAVEATAKRKKGPSNTAVQVDTGNNLDSWCVRHLHMLYPSRLPEHWFEGAQLQENRIDSIFAGIGWHNQISSATPYSLSQSTSTVEGYQSDSDPFIPAMVPSNAAHSQNHTFRSWGAMRDGLLYFPSFHQFPSSSCIWPATRLPSLACKNQMPKIRQRAMVLEAQVPITSQSCTKSVFAHRTTSSFRLHQRIAILARSVTAPRRWRGHCRPGP